VQVSLQQLNTDLHPFHDSHQFEIYGSRNVVGGMIQDVSLVQSPKISFFSFQDPFATCLETMNGPKFLNSFNIEFVSMFFDEFPLRRFFLSLLIKYTQGIQLVDKTLAWLH
jgi:hypothetical protein